MKTSTRKSDGLPWPVVIAIILFCLGFVVAATIMGG